MITPILVIFLSIKTVASAGLFYIPREPSFCIETTLYDVSNLNISDHCYTMNWSQIKNLTTTYTTYKNSVTNQTYEAQIAALTVFGNIEGKNLSYQCPPNGYNGVGPGCLVQPDTQLAVLHVNTLDGKLYGIDLILAGAPFPSPSILQENRPPFGMARHVFDVGVTIQSTGYLKICKTNRSSQCPNRNPDAYKLPHPLPSNYGYGTFGIQAFNFITNSTWIMDDPSQLLIVTAGSYYYYFNGSGYFYYDSGARTCTWQTACNYQCEVYNYDSRFLDYAGEWIVTRKWGVNISTPVAVRAWIGNAIDAAGIFPIIMYTDVRTGHYLGLDKLDTTPSAKMGSTYWYTEHGVTIYRSSILAFHPNVVEGGCASQVTEWAGVLKNAALIFKSSPIQAMLLNILAFISIING